SGTTYDASSVPIYNRLVEFKTGTTEVIPGLAEKWDISEDGKTFTLMSDTLKVTPYAGVKFRHTKEDGYKERSAGDFNLSMNS
ncbi:autotransporter domain-containing protein, partial [Salmonella enterica subsp. enterica serovar Montevideo]|nr:autotransporter domain-containing protein [Salmonella enterica subsp. enterica serovar Montevideo]